MVLRYQFTALKLVTTNRGCATLRRGVSNFEVPRPLSNFQGGAQTSYKPAAAVNFSRLQISVAVKFNQLSNFKVHGSCKNQLSNFGSGRANQLRFISKAAAQSAAFLAGRLQV